MKKAIHPRMKLTEVRENLKVDFTKEIYVNDIEESSEIFDLAQTLANVPEVKEYLTRVNVFLITNGEVKADLKTSDTD